MKNLSWWLIGLPLSWLGLAGLSDSIVTWQVWFEHGIMQHWRELKQMFIDHLLFWTPWQIPTEILDYLVIGAVFARAFFTVIWRFEAPDTGNFKTDVREWLNIALLCIGVTFVWPIFPVVLAAALTGFMGVGIGDKSKIALAVKLIGGTFLTFIPVLFVVSTLLSDFGISP
ncbi:hypothetical protein [Lentilitoribacter sp. Alg239-R112]|uniref:hypothetical protein n=1 Tax=Lentilitoribacter sp. Alg239-R112 TaxID=2305987 RepID=UPI0013A6B00C|nr:hypothetical protein [Lentilitoribacter sp. Alg239-R112]